MKLAKNILVSKIYYCSQHKHITKRERDMGNVEEYKPVMAMILLQLCYAGVTLSARITLVNGTSPRVFILYRQVFATIFIFPFLYFSG